MRSLLANRSVLSMTGSVYILYRDQNHAKYESCLTCLAQSLYEGDLTKSRDAFQAEIKDKLAEKDINSILKDPNNPLTEDEMFAIFHYTYYNDGISMVLRKGKASVYDCYLDYYYSGWNKLGKSATSPLYIGINSDYQLTDMNIFDQNGEFIGEGKTMTTNTISSATDTVGGTDHFVNNKYRVVINLTSSTIPKSIEVISHYQNEKEYNIPPMYNMNLTGKTYTKHCFPTGYFGNVCYDTPQSFTKEYLIIEATEIGLGQPIFTTDTQDLVKTTIQNLMDTVNLVKDISSSSLGFVLVCFVALIIFLIGKFCPGMDQA